MFRKESDVVERSRALLRNKELKNFRQDILKQFPNTNEDELNILLPSKASLTLIKLANRSLLYEIDGKIVFFDVGGRNNIYPTVYSLWICPSMLKAFTTHGPVSRFVLRGADFMAPGISSLEGLTGLAVKDKCYLKIRGNSSAFAVGESQVNLSAIVDPKQRQGKALVVLHSYGDMLVPLSIQRPGFTATEVLPIDQQVLEELKNEDEEEYDEESSEVEEGGEKEGDGEEMDENNEENEENINELTDDLLQEDNQLPNTTNELIQSIPEKESIDYDGILLHAFAITCKYVIKDDQLPMLISIFWNVIQK